MIQPSPFQLTNGSSLRVREAEERDAAAVLHYVSLIAGESDFLTFGPEEFEVTLADERRLLRASLETDNQIYLLAEIDDSIVGSLRFAGGHRPRTRHAGEFGMSVLRAFWGLGIGGHLLEVLIGWAQNSGIITKLNLRVRTDNQRALALYRRFGFELEGTQRREIVIDGESFDHHCMGLLL